MKRIVRAGRHLMLDLTPLRRSHDLRRLFAGQLASMLGSQLTTVAVPYQVYTLRHSSLAVGLVSLAQLLPLIVGAARLLPAFTRQRAPAAPQGTEPAAVPGAAS